MESEHAKEANDMTAKIAELKNLKLDSFKVHNYVDILDENKNWCVGQILNRNGDNVTVHFEGCSSKFDDDVSIKKTQKITHFRTHTKSYTGLKKVAWRDYTFSLEDISEIETLMRFFNEDNFEKLPEAEWITQTLRGKIFTYMDIFMTYQFSNSDLTKNAVGLIFNLQVDFIDMAVRFLQFYNKNTSLVIEYISKHKDLFLLDSKCALLSSLHDILFTLRRIFGEDVRVSEFFKTYDETLRKHIKTTNFGFSLKKNCIEKAYKPSSEYNRLPASIISVLLDYFVDKQGFDLIWKLMLDYNLPFDVLDCLLGFIQLFKVILDYKTSRSNEIIALKTYISNRINNLSETEIKELKKFNFISVLRNVTSLLPHDAKGQKMIFEDLYLNYHFKCLISKNLEKRIQGITAINIIIETVEKKESYSYYGSNQSKIENDEYIEFTDSKVLLTFFRDKNFFDILLGENIHEEIIKRSITFFKFLARRSSQILPLTNSVYDLLWTNFTEKHESIAIQIENIICELSSLLSDSDKLYIFSKMKSQQLDNFSATRSFLIFLKHFTENCFKKYTSGDLDFFKEEKTFGLPLLWKYVQDSTYNSMANIQFSEVVQSIELSSSSISELLSMSTVDDTLKEKLIILCLENVKNHQSTVQSVNLMKKMICELPNNKSKKLVKKLDDSFKIVNLFIEDIQYYLNKAELAQSSCSGDMMNIIYDGYYNHKSNIESRLETINFFCLAKQERGRVELDNQQIESLWKLLVSDSREGVSNLFLEMLRKSCEDLDDHNVEYIFTKIINDDNKFNFEKINMISCNFVEKFLYSVNYNLDRVLNDGRGYRISQKDIIGIDTIFSMLQKVENDSVRNKLTKFLTTLCCDLKSFNEEFCLTYWKSFFAKAMKTLSDSFETKNEKGIRGVLNFFNNIITEIGSPGEIPMQDDVNFVREGYEYNFVFSEKGESRSIKIGYKEYFCDVRVKVAYWFDIPTNMCKFKRQNLTYDMSEDFRIFREVFPQNSNIEVIQSPHPILLLKENPKKMIMNDSKLVLTLHDLLHYSQASYIHLVWKLINLLPKNVQIEKEISNLGSDSVQGEVDWKKHFDEHSIYVLSYSLKILKNFMNEEQWIKNFVKNKGADYLLGLLYKEFNLFNSELSFECLMDLLSLLTKINSNTSMSSEWNSKSIITRMFQIVDNIISASAEKDNDPKLQDLQEKFKRRKEKSFKVDEENEETTENENDDSEFCQEILSIWNEEDGCIKSCISFLQNIFPSETLLTVLLEESDLLNHITIWGLIVPKNFKFKSSLHEFLNDILSGSSHDQNNSNLSNLLKARLFTSLFNIKTFEMANSARSLSFFRISSALMDVHLNGDDFKFLNLDLNSLADNMLVYINSEFSDDTVLEGYFTILRVMILKRREISEILMKKNNMIELILDKCLFSKCQQHSTSATFPKCKTDSSRNSAYKLLTSLAYNNSEFTKQIVAKLNNMHVLGFWKSNKIIDWKISLQYDEKSDYVGLKNLGCTCYMNSLLQQFFMIPQLRESILAAESGNNLVNITAPTSLHSLKNIFSSLKAYDSQYYNAKDFTKNFDGQVLDIREQMDVDEFFNTLIDKVENHLKGTSYQNLFKHFFGFTCSDEFICKGCPHYSEKQVYSQSIQLQVLNKKSIIESLKSYVEGELLEGDNAYYCDKCDKKVNALKRQCIKRLPRILIVVMKRFEFDYETMAKIKVNEYCEFPDNLNMEPYTQEYLRKSEGNNPTENDLKERPEDYYKYSLSGVLIHTGTSESGHYYSLIKDEKTWYEFNDTKVKEYDIADLPNEAFGGTETIYNRDNKKETVEKQTNAYLLFYKRDYEYEADIFTESETEYSNKYFNSAVVNSPYNKLSNIHPTILDRIDSDNLQYWIMKIIFSSEYHSFITDLLINYNTNEPLSCMTKNDNFAVNNSFNDPMNRPYLSLMNSNLSPDLFVRQKETKSPDCIVDDFVMVMPKMDDFIMFKFACSFFFNVLVRSKERSQLPPICDILKAFINKNAIYADWLLEEFSSFDMIEKYLVDCPLIDVRKLSVGIIYSAMIKSYKSNISTVSNDLKNLKDLKIRKFINNVISFYLQHKDNIEKDKTYLYFLIYRFSQLGQESKLYLIEIGVLHFLINLYLSKQGIQCNSLLENKVIMTLTYASPEHSEIDQKLMNRSEKLSAFEELLDKKHTEKLFLVRSENHLIMLLCELYKYLKTDPQIVEKDEIFLKYSAFECHLVQAIIIETKSKPASIAVADMLAVYCHNNMENTQMVGVILLELISSCDSYELDSVMRIFKRFILRIKDSLKDMRIKNYFVKYFNLLLDNFKYWGFIDYNIDFIIKIFYNNYEEMKQYVDNIKDGLIKLLKYLKENPYPPTMVPVKNITMYKKRTTNFPTKVSQAAINNFITRYTAQSNEKINQLKEIYYKNNLKGETYDTDIDLTDFKFSVNDVVKYEGYKAVVQLVLDEMIYIQYDKDEIANTKRPPAQWVDTDNKFLLLVELHEDSYMQVDK